MIDLLKICFNNFNFISWFSRWRSYTIICNWIKSRVIIAIPLFWVKPFICGSLCDIVAFFGAATNTLAPIAIGMEVFGYQYFPFFLVVCAIAYIVNQNESMSVCKKTSFCENDLLFIVI